MRKTCGNCWSMCCHGDVTPVVMVTGGIPAAVERLPGWGDAATVVAGDSQVRYSFSVRGHSSATFFSGKFDTHPLILLPFWSILSFVHFSRRFWMTLQKSSYVIGVCVSITATSSCTQPCRSTSWQLSWWVYSLRLTAMCQRDVRRKFAVQLQQFIDIHNRLSSAEMSTSWFTEQPDQCSGGVEQICYL